jgi:peptide/nickel transport system permease protein
MTATTDTKKVVELLAAEPMPEEQSQFQLVARRFMRHKLAVFSLFMIVGIFLVAIFVEQITPIGASDIEVDNPFASPFTTSEATGLKHWLGTDQLGRDYFARILYAARVSLTVAVTCTLSSALIGIVFGAVAGYYGGVIDALLSRFLEFLLTIPQLPLLLIVSSILLQTPDILPIPQVVIRFMGSIMLIPDNQALQAVVIIVVLVAFGWLGVAQLMRGMVLSLREQQFVEASRAMGANDIYIIFRHMVPNSMAPIIVSASLALGGFIILEAALSFLGFGIQDPTPTWGNMLYAAQSYMFEHPWLPIIPGLPIFICSLAFNFVGDGLRDALDPRLKL